MWYKKSGWKPGCARARDGANCSLSVHFFHVTDIGLLYPVPVQVLVTFSLDD